MNQIDFARALGIGYRTLQRYEAGEDVPNANVVANAAGLAGCSIDQLFSHDTPPV